MGLTEQVNALLKSCREKDTENIKLRLDLVEEGYCRCKLQDLFVTFKNIQKNKRRTYKERFIKLSKIIKEIEDEVNE